MTKTLLKSRQNKNSPFFLILREDGLWFWSWRTQLCPPPQPTTPTPLAGCAPPRLRAPRPLPLFRLSLPDKPLDGSGSRSDWMGSAGDFSREAAPACSHAQLSAHSAARSARGSSISRSSGSQTRCAPRRHRRGLSQNCSRRSVVSLRANVGPDSAQRAAVSSAPRLSSEPRPRSVL